MELFVEKTYILAMRELYQENTQIMSGYPAYANISTAINAMMAAIAPELATVMVLEIQGTSITVQAERPPMYSTDLYQCFYDYCQHHWLMFGSWPESCTVVSPVPGENIVYTQETMLSVLSDADKLLIQSQAV